MSLGPLNIRIFRDAAKKLEASGCASRRVLSFGYPDILCSPGSLEFLFGKEALSKLAYRLWCLSRESLRMRYEQAGVPVIEWVDGEPLDVVLEEVTAFRRHARPVRV